jgi:hypothetical protein
MKKSPKKIVEFLYTISAFDNYSKEWLMNSNLAAHSNLICSPNEEIYVSQVLEEKNHIVYF